MTDEEKQKALDCAQYLGGIVFKWIILFVVNDRQPRRLPNRRNSSPSGIPTDIVMSEYLGVDDCRTLWKAIDHGYFPEPSNPENKKDYVWDQQDLMDWDQWRQKRNTRKDWKTWTKESKALAKEGLSDRFDDRRIE